VNEQPFTAVPSLSGLLLTLADHLDLEPSRPVNMGRVRVRARLCGLTSDWISLLPVAGNIRQSAYAMRLRAIAGTGATR
jgi:hypothetical protein